MRNQVEDAIQEKMKRCIKCRKPLPKNWEGQKYCKLVEQE